MPGHTTAWFVGYPQISPAAQGLTRFDANGASSIRRWIRRGRAPTNFSTDSFAEMTALFPDAYFHIGGDECNGKEWDANPRIQAYMREHDIKDNAALQAYFTGRVQKLVTEHRKIIVGWDEVLQPDTPQDVVIQSWRGPESLAEAARGGIAAFSRMAITST